MAPATATVTAGAGGGVAITATLLDADQRPLAGRTVTFTVSPVTVAQASPQTATTDAAGLATTTLKGLKAGTASVRARAEGVD
ncbi:MAG: Ig-like domain-containing protein, partial [Deferrisomatales bacterium]